MRQNTRSIDTQKTALYDFSQRERCRPELIRCPRQPGELRISRGACARQYVLARKKSSRNGAGVFGNAKLWSLQACRNCPTGRQCLETSDRNKKVGEQTRGDNRDL